jgi:hypothetical protein
LINPVDLRWVSVPAYDGFTGMFALFGSDKTVPIWACKINSAEVKAVNVGDGEETNGSVQMNLRVYQPDKITAWVGNEGSHDVQPIAVLGASDDQTELPWTLDKIPVVAFINKRDNYNEYGKSEVRTAIPLQNALNRTLYNLLMTGDHDAFKIKWSKGYELSLDGIVPGTVINMLLKDTGGKVITDFTDSQIEFMKAAAVGEFGGSDPKNYSDVMAFLVTQISHITQTPIYGVTAQGNLSGEALKQLEIGLIGKTKRFQKDNTEAVKQLVLMTNEMQRTISIDGFTAPVEVDTVAVMWSDPQIIDTNAKIAVLISMREKTTGLWADSFYRKVIGALLGMSKTDIQDEEDAVKLDNQFDIETFTGGLGQAPAIAAVAGGGAGADGETPENIAAEKSLAGIQVKEAQSILDKATAGTLSRIAAIELLLSLGFTEESAIKMIDAQSKIKLTAPTPTAPTADNLATLTGGANEQAVV